MSSAVRESARRIFWEDVEDRCVRAAFVSMGVGGVAQNETGLSECLMLLFIDYNFQVVDLISYLCMFKCKRYKCAHNMRRGAD